MKCKINIYLDYRLRYDSFSLKFGLSHLPKYSLLSLGGQFWDSLYMKKISKVTKGHFVEMTVKNESTSEDM